MTALALLLLAGFPLTAQPIAFEAASVKRTNPSTPDGRMIVGMLPPSGGPGTDDPGRIRYSAVSLYSLLTVAFELKPHDKIVGPDWLETDSFQIDATMPPDTTKDQFREMLQNLLAERFRLKAHREGKDTPAWAIMVARNGPKMKESKELEDVPIPPDAWENGPPPAHPQLSPDGFNLRPQVPRKGAGMFTTLGTQGIRLTARQQTMQSLAKVLGAVSKRPVFDETGLTAKYDFILTFYREGATLPGGEPLPDIFNAIQSQLGLKLESRKGSVQQLVIDHVDRIPQN